jgi:tripeptide aminopeptidase
MFDVGRLADRFIEMCRVNTPARREAELVGLVQARLERLGLECVRDEANAATGGDSGNLIATLPATAEALPLFFSCHFDTVEPNPGLKVVMEDGLIRSDGSTILGADDKAGMAPLLEAIEYLVTSGEPHGLIQLVLTVSEEVGLLGAHNLDRSLVRARHGYVLDTGPPVGSIVYTAPTQDTLEIAIEGRPAHAGFEPERGISAIEIAADAIVHMHLGRIDHETTANVGIIQGGSATNVVCPHVTMWAEARSRNPEKLRFQVEHMRFALTNSAAARGGRVQVKVMRQYETYRLEPSDSVIVLASEAAARLGLEVKLREAGGGSDANVFNTYGWQTCVLGTGMRNIHTHEECVHVDDLVRLAEWVVEICRAARGVAA